MKLCILKFFKLNLNPIVWTLTSSILIFLHLNCYFHLSTIRFSACPAAYSTYSNMDLHLCFTSGSGRLFTLKIYFTLPSWGDPQLMCPAYWRSFQQLTARKSNSNRKWRNCVVSAAAFREDRLLPNLGLVGVQKPKLGKMKKQDC